MSHARHISIALLALTLAACSSAAETSPTSTSIVPDDSTSSSPSAEVTMPPTTEAAPATEAPTTEAPTTTVDPTVAIETGAWAYYVALQQGDVEAVREAVSERCDSEITDDLVRIASFSLAGFDATVTVLSMGEETASVNIDSEAVEGNDGTGTQFRWEEGSWRWDDC